MTPSLIEAVSVLTALAAMEDNPSRLSLSTADWILAAFGATLWMSLIAHRLTAGARRPPALSDRQHALNEHSIAVAVLAYLLASVFASALAPHVTANKDFSQQLVGIGAHMVGALICLWVGARWFAGGLKYFLLGDGPTFRGAGTATAYAVIAIGVCPWLLWLTVHFAVLVWPNFKPPTHDTISVLKDGGASVGLVIVVWLGATVVAPCAEELFFRGLVQSWLAKLTENRWKGVVLSSAVFAMVHFTQPQAVAPLFVLSLLLGYVYEKTGTLIWPIMMHAAFNLKTLIWMSLGAYGDAS